MKKWLLPSIAILLILFGCENRHGTFLETVESNSDVPSSIARLVEALKVKDLTHFTTIDHSANAEKIGMLLKPETVVVFGSPKVGTKLMVCNASMGLDLPLRILFTTDYEGITHITYTNPEYWTLKHNIKDKGCLTIIQKMHIMLKQLAGKAAGK
ncbi:MAG: DUF302 domain-containing protein [Sulfurovum sp.]|nr:DUF302 domain-containing protein [Sulfurovum sp.]MCB4780400.1 DUF302 domain-containing protein [Sulfurovum sp.]